MTYQNNEAAFQSAKVTDKNIRKEFTSLNPSDAKKKGRRVQLRENWDSIKFDIMYDIVKRKFTQNPDLMAKLLSTGNAYLEEGNTWGDRTWGTVNGKGRNNLGIILMRVRDELKNTVPLISFDS